MKNGNRLRKLLVLSTLITFGLVLCATNPYRPALAQGGTWETKASTPAPIGGHAVGVVNGKLYSVGGDTAPVCCAVPAPTYAYDPATNTWTTRTSMSVRRKNLAAGVVSGILYAVGGDDNFSFFGTNEAYDPATDTWTAKAGMPTPRNIHAAGVVNGILYALGGSNVGGILTTVEAYDPATDTWTTKAPMLHARRSFAVAVVNGILYAIGGDVGGPVLDSVEAYNPATDTWTNKAPMPTARSALAAAVVNGIIYAIGGFNNGVLSTVEAYDPATDAWTTIAPMPTARSSPGAGEINGVIYAVGGVSSFSPTVIAATLEAFTTSSPVNKPPVAICANVAVAAGPSCTANASIDNGSFDPDAGDTITLSQSPPEPYPLGKTLVTLTVTDNHGTSSQCTATVTVVDTTPPAIACPAVQPVTANLGSSSAAVGYPAPSASDNCGLASVVCSPPSGSSFPAGANAVTCTATDSSGNTASCSFAVTVLSPQQVTQSLANSVASLVSQGVLNQGEGNALTSKLQAAIRQMDNGNGNPARNQLQAFIHQVNAMMQSGRLTPAQGQALIDAANNVIAHIP